MRQHPGDGELTQPGVFASRIGGVVARVRSSTLRLSPRQDPAYAPFLSAEPARLSAPSDIEIEAVRGTAPPPTGPLLFEGSELWSVYEDGPGYRLVFAWGAPDLGGTVARCSADTSEVTAYVQTGRSDVAGPPAGLAPDGADPLRYPLDQLLLMGHLAERGGVLVHSAGLVLDGAGLVLAGESGSGKSTVCRLLAAAGLGAGLLSDERTVVRLEAAGEGAAAAGAGSAVVAGAGSAVAAAGFRVWGTPWASDAGVARNASAPLRALLFLVKDDVCGVVPVPPAAAVHRLLPLVTCPWYDRRLVPGVLDTCGLLVESVPCLELHFMRTPAVAETLRALVAGLT